MPRRVKIPPRLWKAIGSLELAGIKLSNIAYNLSQQEGKIITRQMVESMRECYEDWDESKAKLSSLL